MAGERQAVQTERQAVQTAPCLRLEMAAARQHTEPTAPRCTGWLLMAATDGCSAACSSGATCLTCVAWPRVRSTGGWMIRVLLGASCTQGEPPSPQPAGRV